MTIKVAITANVAPLDGLEAYMEQFPKKAQAIGKDVYEQIKPLLLDELRFYPPVPPRSRYVRTFRLRNNWTVTFESLADGFKMSIQNSTAYAQWVVGSLAQNEAAAKRFQQPFHAKNGWPLATQTSAFWFDAFVDEFTKAFLADIGEFAKTTFGRRAVTRIA